MSQLLFLAASPAISQLLMTFLYAFLVIALLGGIIWAINRYVAPIPPPILVVLAVVLVIVAAIYLLRGSGL